MPRPRHQKGWLSAVVPGNAAREPRKLPRGRYWAQWHQYYTLNGSERRRRREKVIDREVAERFRIGLDYEGPLTKADAQRVLDILIAADNGGKSPMEMGVTFAVVAQQYLAMAEPNWDAHTLRSSKNLIERHLIEKLGKRPVRDINPVELQMFLNGYVNAESSKSLLDKFKLYLRAILDVAVSQRVIDRNPARDPGAKLKARSRKGQSERALMMDESAALLAQVSGVDRLIVRTFIQLGLRPEEMFALRRNDRAKDWLMIDEPGALKSTASKAAMHLPADLEMEFDHWLETVPGKPTDQMFSGYGKGKPAQDAFIKKVLKPAAERAGLADVNYQVLRRTSATLFGARAKDPKLLQGHMRHADPGISLKNYQKEVPSESKAAGLAFEVDLLAAIEEAEGAKETVN